MNINKMLCRGLVFVSLLLPTLVYAERVLDKIEVVQTQTEADIHIEFLTQVRYLRHFPTNETSRVQIFLDFLHADNPQREFLVSPPSDLVPGFTVNYPDQKTDSIGVRFKKPVKFRISPDSSGRGIILHVLLSKDSAPLEPVVVVPTLPVVAAPLGELPAKPEGMSDNDYASKLVAEGRVARGVGDYPKAIQLLNAVLGLPANPSSQEAQELIGNSREKMGESIKAKAEYELYLKLYPEGEGAVRVRQRLAIIDAATKVSGADTTKAKKPFRDVHETTVYGSWNQYYYDAHSHNYNPSPTPDSKSHDQSSLVSGIDLTARSRQNEYDNKIVFRNNQTMDFLSGNNHSNFDRTLAAYVEVQNKDVDYLVRVGRQNGNSGGVLGRFDGAWFRYGLTPKYRINLVAGSLDESSRFTPDYKRHFYGVNLDIGPLAENWSGNAFVINQEVDHLTDRRAVGGELRYFANGRSVYSLVDYDVYFNRLNTAMVQGNWQTEGGTNYNMLIDHRKSPVLQLINSLPAIFQFGSSNPAEAMRLGVTPASMRKDAIALTLDTELYLFGATRQITPRWQLGGDIQMNRSSGTQAAGAEAIALAIKAAADAGRPIDPLALSSLQSSIGTGNIWVYHVQAVGLDTLFKNDTSVISVSFQDGQVSRSQSLVLSNVVVPREKWRLDSSIKLQRIETDPSTITRDISPTVRASYRLREKATLEAEIGLQFVNTDDLLSGHSSRFSDYSFVGYRLDL